MQLLDQPTRSHNPCYIYFDKLFTPQQCQRIIDMGLGRFEDAHIGDDHTAMGANVRQSQVAWLHHSDQTRWIYQRLNHATCLARDTFYPFHMSGLWEPLQLTRYDAESGGHYAPHKDIGAGPNSRRKLSISVVLNDPKDFAGGQLRMLGQSPDPTVTQATQGTAIVFPSYELHQVAPVTRGHRFSLVTWVHGAPFQ